MSSRYCVDCKHCGPDMPYLGRRCMRPKSNVPNLVSGRLPILWRRCFDERQRGWFRKTCGPDGKYWEEKA